MKKRMSRRRRNREQNTSLASDETSFEDKEHSKSTDDILPSHSVEKSFTTSLNVIQEENNSVKDFDDFRAFRQISSTQTSTPNSKHYTIVKEIVANTDTFENLYTKNQSIDSCVNSTANSFIPAPDFFASQSSQEDIPSDYFSGSDTPKKLSESTRRLTLVKPFNSYIAYSSDEELDEWWDKPKTDYTYSASLTYRECVTPDRQIDSPNMSRRGVRRPTAPHMHSPPFSQKGLQNSLDLRSRRVSRKAYSNFSDESADEADSVSNIKVNSSSTNSHTTTRTNSYTHLNESRTLSHGLDGESDIEDEYVLTSTPLDRFSQPLHVRKGPSSLLASSVKLQQRIPYDPNISYSDFSHNEGRKIRLLQKRTWRDIAHSCFESITSWFLYLVFLFTLLHTTVTKAISQTYNYLSHYFTYHRKVDLASEQRQPLYLRVWSFTKTVTTTIITTTTSTTTTLCAPIHRAGNFGVTTLQKMSRSYQTRRRQNPCLWSWLPLLILLLLAFLCFGVYQWRRDGQSDGSIFTTSHLEATTPVEKNNTTSFLSYFTYMFNKMYSISSWAFSSIFSYSVDLLISYRRAVVSVFSYLTNVSYSSMIYCWNFLSRLLPNSGTFPAVVNNISTAFHNGINSSFHIASSTLLYVKEVTWSVLAVLTEGLYFILSTSGSAVLSVWSAIWAIISAFLGWVSSSAALIVSLFYNGASRFYLFLPFASLKTSSMDYPHSPTQATGESSDTLIAAALQSSHFHSILSSTIEKAFKERSVSKEQIELTITNKLKEEVNLLKATLLQSPGMGDEHLKTLVINLQEKSHQLSKKLDEINARNSMEEMTRTELTQTLGQISNSINDIYKRLDKVENDNSEMMIQLKNCCNKSVSLEDVNKHIGVLFKDFLPSTDSSLSGSPSNFGSWLKTYFVAKGELEEAVNVATSQLKTQIINESKTNKNFFDKALDQSMKQLMDEILEKIRNELKRENTEIHTRLENLDQASSKAMNLIKEEVSTSKSIKNEFQEAILDLQNAIEKNTTTIIQQMLSGSLGEEVSMSIVNQVKKNMSMNGEKAEGSQTQVDAIKDLLPQVVADYITSNKTLLQGLFENNPHNLRGTSLNADVLSYTAGQTQSDEHISLFSNSILNESYVRRIVKEALLKYDADKTGLVDHALESAGGAIVSTKCTESYAAHQAEWTIYGFVFFWQSVNDPRSVIQPGRMPGECYAFKGEGTIVIQLAGPVQLTGFSLEHIPESLTPSGKIDSAPKDFSVYGLHKVEDDGTLIGKYQYVRGEDPLQYFKAKNATDVFYPYVQLKVHTNHGNVLYTCIYRFRVHGVRDESAYKPR